MIEQGDYLRHRARPDWGVGQVLNRGEDRIDVLFGRLVVPLKLSVASTFLERVTKAEALLAGVLSTEGATTLVRPHKKRGRS